MKRIYQTILVSTALLFCVQAAQAAMMPIAHDFSNSSFTELGGFDPDPTVPVGTETPSGPGTHLAGETNPSGQKSATVEVTDTGDSYYEIWFGFNLASATSLAINTAGSLTLDSSGPLDTILALYLADESNGAILDQNDNCGGLVTSCLTFDNLAAGEYIAGVSIAGNIAFVHGWPFDMTTVGPDNDYVSGHIKLNISAVPVPAAVWLFGTALIGFVGLSRRRSIKT